MEGEEQRSGIGKRDRFINFKRSNRGADDVLGETTKGLLGHRSNALAHPLLGALTACVDNAKRFHAGAVGKFRANHHVAARDALKIVEVQRNGLSLDPNFTGPRFGDLNLVEAQDLSWLAIFMDSPCPHEFPLETLFTQFTRSAATAHLHDERSEAFFGRLA